MWGGGGAITSDLPIPAQCLVTNAVIQNHVPAMRAAWPSGACAHINILIAP